MPRLLPVLFHTIGITLFSHGLLTAHQIDATGARESAGGLFQFLTIIGITLSLMTCFVSLVHEFMRDVQGVKTLKYLLLAVAYPGEVVIGLLYWSILFLDSSLLLRRGIDQIPLFLDLTLHLLPMIILTMDFLFFSHDFQKSFFHSAMILLFVVWYYLWSHYLFSLNKRFPYPLLDKLSGEQRAAFFVGSGLLALGVYELGAILHKTIHRQKRLISKKQE